MNAELNWNDAVAYFGREMEEHADSLSIASQSTYGILACRLSDTAKFVSGNGEHAEQKLIRSPLWMTDLHSAIAEWDLRSQPTLILLALNRSPCSDCAHHLAHALHQLKSRYALRAEKQHFLLASLGYYHSYRELPRANGNPKTFTTNQGIRVLREAGWKQCTLRFNGKLTRRGKQLNDYLANSSKWG